MRGRLFCLAGLALAAGPATADELLLLKSGHTLVVSGWRFEGADIFLMLPGDGLVVVDRSVLVEARLASGPAGVVTWRREDSVTDGSPSAIADATPGQSGGPSHEAVQTSTPAPARPRPVEAHLEGGVQRRH